MLTPQRRELTQTIKEEALRLGFCAVGIAPGSALDHRRRELSIWLEAGLSGNLSYMELFFDRQRRFRQQTGWVPRSAIVLAAPYGQSAPERIPSGHGRIARYAQGRDYHRALKKRLKRLGAFIQRQATTGAAGPARLAFCVDTSPLLERALAEAAGLGFFGKNTMLIRPRGGSYFFLAAVLTDLELTPDQPLRWDCGSCTLCIEACPTGALREPYRLDAGRCISNLTIENRGEIPEPLRPLVGNWLFGCDICQNVCPYNRSRAARPAAPWHEFLPESGAGGSLSLRELLAIRSDSEFAERFAGTPLMRAKRSGLLRNAAVAAANSDEAGLLPVLEAAAGEDPSPLVRQHATRAISCFTLKAS